MREDWTPIERTGVEVLGVDPDASALLKARITLSSSPPPQWKEYFDAPIGVQVDMSMHPPRLAGSTLDPSIFIRFEDDHLERYVQHVDERIAAANARYEETVLPRLRAEAEDQRRRLEDEQRRLEDARRRAGEL